MTGEVHRLLMTADAVGGIWTYAVDLSRALVDRGTHVTLAVVGPAASPARRDAARDAGLDVVDLHADPEWLASGPDAVRRGGEALAALARRSGAELIQLNHAALAAETAFETSVVTVCHSCVTTWWAAVKGTPLPDDLGWQARLIGQGYRAATALVAPSQAFAEATRSAYGLSDTPIVVHNGRTAAALPATRVAPIVGALTVGRLWDDGKDVATLDRAASLTAVPIRAAGWLRGPNGTAVVLDHIAPLGEVNEAGLHRHLAERPIFVSSARYEPFGLAVLEAAQAGCALVLSDITSFRELWGEAALFVAPGDAPGFAAALDRLIGDPALRARLAEAACRRAASYSIAAQTDRMLGVFAAALGHVPAGVDAT